MCWGQRISHKILILAAYRPAGIMRVRYLQMRVLATNNEKTSIVSSLITDIFYHHVSDVIGIMRCWETRP